LAHRFQALHRRRRALGGAGLHRLGLPPAIGRSLLLTYAIPAMTYGAEVIHVSDTWLNKFDDALRRAVAILLGVPWKTPAVYFQGELNWHEAEHWFNMMKLRYFGALEEMPNDRRTRQLWVHRRRMAGDAPVRRAANPVTLVGAAYKEDPMDARHGYDTLVRTLLRKYDMGECYRCLLTAAEVEAHALWNDKLERRMAAKERERFMTELTRADRTIIPRNYAPLWRDPRNADQSIAVQPFLRDIPREAVPLVCQLRSGYAPLRELASHLLPRSLRDSTACDMCKTTDETREHFLFDCPLLQGVRASALRDLRANFADLCVLSLDNPRWQREDQLRLILGARVNLPKPAAFGAGDDADKRWHARVRRFRAAVYLMVVSLWKERRRRMGLPAASTADMTWFYTIWAKWNADIIPPDQRHITDYFSRLVNDDALD
jgi:hypothetical protein